MTAWCVIPCGARKRATAAPAAELYVGDHFRMQLRAALTITGDSERVRILSAKHGLLPLDKVIEPYDLKMGDEGSVTYTRIAGQILLHWIFRDDPVSALLPKAYYRVFADALAYLGLEPPANLYLGSRGIGHQRAIAAGIVRSAVPS